MTILNIFLMAGQTGGNPLTSFLPLILIMVVFYFFMIYPQMKKTKAQKKFRETLDKGTKVITIGGIHAKITDVGENYFIIESEGTKLKVDKTSISMEASQVLNAPKKEEKK
ncbi:MAG: preprotein translocase subunit YajC [Bacteroidota bacterium]|jgi:preprotein translocase subunit YajC